MMRTMLAACAALAVLATVSTLPAAAQVRTSPGLDQQPQQRLLLVNAVFDPAEAKAALDPGTATIRGLSCSYHDGGMYRPDYRAVYLLPLTPYLQEWLDLRKKARRNEVVAPLLQSAFEMRVETETDDKGRFQFTRMRPGRYYLFMQFDFARAVSGQVYAGTSYGAYGSVDHYSQQTSAVGESDTLERIVEVERDGQTVHATLFRGAVINRILPCRL